MDYLQYKLYAVVFGNESKVLNLIINGLPSIQYYAYSNKYEDLVPVLNLIINGLPSIHATRVFTCSLKLFSFKPYYKWITFNTPGNIICFKDEWVDIVLNLIINGLPSIPLPNKSTMHIAI